MKERYREEYNQFKESIPVKALFMAHEKSLMACMEMHAKLDGAVMDGAHATISYNAYMKMG